MTVSDRAAQRLKELLSTQNQINASTALKIGVKRRGCNGLSYTLNYATKPDKFDEVIEEKEGVKIFVDSKALMVLVGTEMDYIEDELSSEFVFNNPNEKGKCGCGESFNV